METVTRYGIMLHCKNGDGEWEPPRMDDELFESYEEACNNLQMSPRFSDFDREINDAFAAVVTITSVV